MESVSLYSSVRANHNTFELPKFIWCQIWKASCKLCARETMLCNCSMEWISFGFHGKRIFKFWAANRNWTEWEYSQPQHLASMLTYFSSRSSFNVNAYRKNSHSQSMNHLNALHSQQILHSWINIYVNRMHVWSSQRTKIACTFGLRLIYEK